MNAGVPEEDTDSTAATARQASGHEVGGVGEFPGCAKHSSPGDLGDPGPSVDRLGRGSERHPGQLRHLRERGLSVRLHEPSICTTRKELAPLAEGPTVTWRRWPLRLLAPGTGQPRASRGSACPSVSGAAST